MIGKPKKTTLTLTVEGDDMDEPIQSKPAPGRKPRRATAKAQAEEAASAKIAGADLTTPHPVEVSSALPAQAGAADGSSASGGQPKPGNQPKPSVQPKPGAQPKPSAQQKPGAQPKPGTPQKPASQPKPSGQQTPGDQTLPSEQATTNAQLDAPPAPKRRGRPPKNPRPEGGAAYPVAVTTGDRATGDATASTSGSAGVSAGGSASGGSNTGGSAGSGSNAGGSAGGSAGGGSNGHQQGQNNQQVQNNQQGQQARRQRRQPNNPREIVPSVTREDLAELKIGELREKAAELELDVSLIKKKDELIDAVLAAAIRAEGFVECEGIFDLLGEGYGFLRTSGYLPGETDVYVGMAMVRRNGLRKGDYVRGQVRPARDNEKFAALHRIDSVNGLSLEELQVRPRFADLTPVYPDERLLMEHGQNTITARTIDLVAPIGKGQRGLIVSPPKAGKTTILKDIAAAISANDPKVHLMCLLVDERPEEVTDMERSINGEVVSSTFDMPSENHIAVAELVIERAKRLVEAGRDVVILLDSITRLARAYNLAQPASGRILSGGVDSTALYPPKRFLGAARNIEGGGSLTILASALIDTGSKMDEVIFEEFKGTGNMELKLDRDLADRRVFPAIDPVSSGTRKEELLLDAQEAPLIWAVRRILANMNNTERAMEMLIKSLKQTRNNAEFLLRTAKKAQQKSSAESIDL